MNRQISKSRALEYIIAAYALIAILLIGPLGCLDSSRTVSGAEKAGGTTMTIGESERIQQVFVGDGGYLETISIYTQTDLVREVFTFTVTDETGETYFSRRVAIEDYEAPGFFTIPVEFQTVDGRLYVWEISHTEKDFTLCWQDTADSGLSILGDYYTMDADGTITEMAGQSLLMRLTYSDPLPAATKAAMCAGIILVAGFIILVVENSARMRKSYAGKKEELVKVQWALRRVADPVLIVLLLLGLYAVNGLEYYGTARADKMVYSAGIIFFAAFMLFVVNVPRDTEPVLTDGRYGNGIPELIWKKGTDWLQTIAWAGVIWGCIDYVNALYNIGQDYGYRKVLIFLGLAVLAMWGDRESGDGTAPWNRAPEKGRRAFLVAALVWLVVSVLGTAIWVYPYRDVEETGKLMQLTAGVIVVGGLVLIRLVWLIWKKRASLSALNLPYTILLAVLFALLVIFRNTRGWPIYLVVAFSLVYVFYLCWRNRERFLMILCNGIILNFACCLIFSILRRPLRAWLYYRYNFVFHTVTVTAAYLTLVLCALLVRLLKKYHEDRRLKTYWGTALLTGMDVSLLVMTLSRTGILAAAVMGVFVLLFVSFACYRERLGYFLVKIGMLLLLVLLSFPVTYSSVRLIPPLYDDPYIFELEENEIEWAVNKGDPADSENYLTFSRFAYCFDVKLFGDEHRVLREFVDTFMAEAETGTSTVLAAELAREEESDALLLAGGTAYDDPASVKVSGGEDAEDAASGTQADTSSQEEDYTNGRLEIFKLYIAQWNLTGHDIMGVEQADGSLTVHAHNTYLQVIHDHGLITGVVYVLFGLVSLIRMLQYALWNLRGMPGGRSLLDQGSGDTAAGLAGGDHEVAARTDTEENGEDGCKRDPYAALPLAIFLAYAVAGLVEWLFHPCNAFGLCACLVLAPLLTFKGKRRDEGR